MRQLRLIWPPAPYTAGFCVTDDTDAASMEQVRAVYDFLAEQRFLSTKTVWAFPPEEGSGIPHLPDSALRGITLEDAEYREYCRELHRQGFEICLHGASAGNNRRDRQHAAIQLMRKEFGRPGTYICHAKNADNPYWEGKVTRLLPFRWLLGAFSQHECSGEDPESPYYWGDLCYSSVAQIRLFRTRRMNTLAVNPSMPYFDPGKPLVRSWFTATKRALRDCATPEALATLRREHGLTVLYQYMHRYADRGTLKLNADFVAAVERIRGCEEILVAPAGTMMARLRLMQGVFIAVSGNRHWAVNITDETAHGVQLSPGDPASPCIAIPPLPATSITNISLPANSRVGGRNILRLDRTRTGALRTQAGQLLVNCGETAASPGGGSLLAPMTYRFVSSVAAAHHPLSVLSKSEELRLLTAQSAIILRELLFRGRSMSTQTYLRGDHNPLELHENW